MEDTAAIVSYGYDHDHYDKLVKKPRLDQYETVDDEYSRFDAYEDEDEDVSSVDSRDCYGPGGKKLSVEEAKNIKRETDQKFKLWKASIKAEDKHALFDTTGACILERDGHKLMLNDVSLFLSLVSFVKMCRRRMIIYTFTYPGVEGTDLDGGGTRGRDISELSDLEFQSYSTKARQVIQQYNDAVTSNKHFNPELDFASLTWVTDEFPNDLFITFTARQYGNCQIGTYQAALADDFFDDQVHLVLLRHVEADKILAIMSISGADEALEKRYREDWSD